MRVPAIWGALPLLAGPLGAWALGLGDIQVQSALNQPFAAEILLDEAAPEDVAGLSVALASRQAFERFGLDRPGYLSSLEFSVGRNADGADAVLIRSAQPIAEPFVTLLVEANWPRGSVTREYTVLLDPPLLAPSPGAAVPVEPAEARAPQANIRERAASPQPAVPPVPGDTPELQANAPAQAIPPRPLPDAAAEAQAAPVAVRSLPDAAAEAQAAPSAPRPLAPASARGPGATYGPVQRGDTLWAIASRYRPDDVSLFQTLLAFYEANPEAFAGNMNRLYAGAILRIPDSSEIGSMAADSARAEFARQTDEWRQGPRQQARLRLVPPTPAESQPGGVDGAAGDDREVSELRDQVAALSSELAESRRLLEIRDRELRELQARVGAQTAAAPEAPEASEADAMSTAAAEQLFADETRAAVDGGAEPDAARSAADPEPVSATRAILASPLTWIAVGTVLVLLTAFLFLRRGLRKATDFELDLRDLRAEPDDPGAGDGSPSAPQALDDIGTRLDLARAYIDMGNAGRARAVLAEVLEEGDSGQREEARTLFDALDDQGKV